MRFTTAGCLIAVLFFMFSCSTKKVIDHHHEDEHIEEFTFDPIDISPEDAFQDTLPRVYRPTATMTYDIIHTRLDLRFDWQNNHVLGKANLKIKPYFFAMDSLRLDAVGFDIHKVSLSSGRDLTYRYDGSNLVVLLDKSYTRLDTFNLFIDYTAKPDENPISGSEAITSDKGLFFINPKGNDPDLPTQIWTQGETENNSRWFPTFDKPNERFSQEIFLTVDSQFTTLSNGLLISSKNNADGTRTDYWKQDKPHAPYLAMIAIGNFHTEQDTWNGIPLTYMVDPKYAKYAKDIYKHTPEMLTFFSKILNYPYPWDKYSQVLVHKYVSGAMENTGAVVFGDFIQKTDRELIDDPNDEIIAHEMMHHWFGDLVTCEDWSNLTLNEGFANYAEYLWKEYKYGRDEAELHRLFSTNQYYEEIYYGKSRPVVDYYYDDKESMFDRHSYNKGGLILHMLRQYLGDEAFYASLNRYLVLHAGTSVELDELRMAFEDTVGEDLNWFFNQWFLGTGHPHIHVQYQYDNINKSLTVHADQSDTPYNFSYPFVLPVDVAVYYADGTITYHSIRMTDTIQDFVIENLKEEPISYVFDGHNALLANIMEEKSDDQYKQQFLHSPNFNDKIEAIKSLESTDDIIPEMLSDKSFFIRSVGIENIPDSLTGYYVDKLQEMAMSDPDSRVRRFALFKLLEVEDNNPLLLCSIILNSEKAYPVLEVALYVMGSNKPEHFNQYFNQFKNEDSDYLVGTLVRLLPDEREEYLDYVDQKAKTISLKYINEFYTAYLEYVQPKELKVIQRAIEINSKIADPTHGNFQRKLYAMNTLVKLSSELIDRHDDLQAQLLLSETLSKITKIAREEMDPELLKQKIYQDFRE